MRPAMEEQQESRAGDVTRTESMDGRLIMLTAACSCGGQSRGTHYSSVRDENPFTHLHWVLMHCTRCSSDREAPITHSGHPKTPPQTPPQTSPRPWWPQ
jgi:hypothetical protein